MAKTPWLTSDGLIAAVQRRISVPLSEVTFTEDDILEFANHEMQNSQVPSIMQYHQEYFVSKTDVELEVDKVRYAIPDRAIGLKLRDLFYQDESGSLTQMVQINADDQDIYSTGSGTQEQPYTYYLEGNDVVLTTSSLPSPTGSLVFSFFMRPNQLVVDSKAAICESFQKEITITVGSMVAGDSLSINGITFTAVASGAGDDQFVIGGTSIITATNLATAINNNGEAGTASNSTPATAIVTVTYTDRTWEFESTNEVGMTVSDDLLIKCTEDIPSNIENSTNIDFLQTKAGHKTYAYDITLSSDAISGDTFTITDENVPNDFLVGDYICSSYECIIPQIPTDLHSLLVERTCARILASQGDMEMLGHVNQKVQEMESRQGNMVGQRVEGSPIKVVNRYSALRSGKWNFRNIF